MAVEVTDELVRHVALLARLALSSDQKRELKSHFEKVLAYVETLEELDTTGADSSHFSAAATNVYREDEKKHSLPVEKGLANAPQSRDSSFVVPRIIDNSGGA